MCTSHVISMWWAHASCGSAGHGVTRYARRANFFSGLVVGASTLTVSVLSTPTAALMCAAKSCGFFSLIQRSTGPERRRSPAYFVVPVSALAARRSAASQYADPLRAAAHRRRHPRPSGASAGESRECPREVIHGLLFVRVQTEPLS